MKLSQKLIVGFVAVALLVVVVGFLGLYANNRLVAVFESGEERFDSIVIASTEISSYAKRAEGHAMLYITLNDPPDRKKFYERIESLRNQTRIINETAKNPEARKIFANITSETAELQSAGESLFRAYDEEVKSTGKFEPKSQSELIRNINKISSKIREGGVKLATLETHMKSEQESIAKEKAEVLFKIIFAISGGAIFAALFIGYVFARSISTPVEKLKIFVANIGSGKLDAKLGQDTKDEFSELGGMLNKMAADLKTSREELLVQSRITEESKFALESKIKELTDTKSAMLNMMDDADRLNQELMDAKTKLEANLKELKAVDVKKNEFMSIAAHELKTPMTSIHGFSQLLQNPAIAKDAEKRGKYLKIIDHETSRLGKLVNDVLDLSRIDIGAVTFDIAEADVNTVLEQVKTEMAVQARSKGLAFECDIPQNLPKIKTDKERLVQILLNLLNNAVKYTPDGKIILTVINEENSLHFIVKDTGIGIPKNKQTKIFRRFYQVDSSYTRSAGGVGLGLSLCKHFVELLGGRIWFISAQGKGSEFHFTMPVKRFKKTGTVGGANCGRA